jgi:hypothetical protein
MKAYALCACGWRKSNGNGNKPEGQETFPGCCWQGILLNESLNPRKMFLDGQYIPGRSQSSHSAAEGKANGRSLSFLM